MCMCMEGCGSEAALDLLSSNFKEGLSGQEAEDLVLRAINCACGDAEAGSEGTKSSHSKNIIIKHIREGFS